MKIFRRLLAFILAVSLLLTITGCESGKISTQVKSIKIKVIVKKKDADFWAVVKMGAEAAGKEFGVIVDFDGPTNEKNVDEQIRMVDAAINQKVDALVLAASDYTKLVDVAEKAVAENIPVIVIDSDIQSNKTNSFIGTDNVDAGRILGESLVDKVGASCNVAVMSFIKGAASSDQREEGLFKELTRHSSVKVVKTEYCNSDENMADLITRKLVKDFPELDAIICTNAYGTAGTARAIEKLGLSGKVKVIGFDSTPEEISFMENDVIQSLVVQNPFSMGYLGVKQALDALKGKALSKRIKTESKVIDKSNMYQPENQKLLFPFTN